jgi:hypothetical protein
METKGINIIEEALKKHNGENVVIRISHKLFGVQKINTKLNYIFDEKRVGFSIKRGQEIYIYKDEVKDFGVEGSIYFADDLMKIDIKLNEQ